MKNPKTEEMIENSEKAENTEEVENTEEIEKTEEAVEDGGCESITEEDIEALRSKKLTLEEEIATLEGELEKKREETDRKVREYSEFKELFPNADTSELAPEVLAMVESGVPLCAAYALYEKRLCARNAAAETHNKATKQRAFGSVGLGSDEEFYTPDEVRAMTQSEVKKNYQKILRSMKNWH